MPRGCEVNRLRTVKNDHVLEASVRRVHSCKLPGAFERGPGIPSHFGFCCPERDSAVT